MSERRQREVAYVSASRIDNGYSVIGEPIHIDSFHQFLQKKWPRLSHSRPADVDLSDQRSIEFPLQTEEADVIDALVNWKEWYASDACQLLFRFDNMRRAFDEQHSPKRGILRIPKTTKYDFRKCESRYWQEEGWEVSDDLVTKILHGSENELLEALKTIFAGQGIADIQIVNSGEMEIVPVE